MSEDTPLGDRLDFTVESDRCSTINGSHYQSHKRDNELILPSSSADVKAVWSPSLLTISPMAIERLRGNMCASLHRPPGLEPETVSHWAKRPKAVLVLKSNVEKEGPSKDASARTMSKWPRAAVVEDFNMDMSREISDPVGDKQRCCLSYGRVPRIGSCDSDVTAAGPCNSPGRAAVTDRINKDYKSRGTETAADNRLCAQWNPSGRSNEHMSTNREPRNTMVTTQHEACEEEDVINLLPDILHVAAKENLVPITTDTLHMDSGVSVLAFSVASTKSATGGDKMAEPPDATIADLCCNSVNGSRASRAVSEQGGHSGNTSNGSLVRSDDTGNSIGTITMDCESLAEDGLISLVDQQSHMVDWQAGHCSVHDLDDTDENQINGRVKNEQSIHGHESPHRIDVRDDEPNESIFEIMEYESLAVGARSTSEVSGASSSNVADSPTGCDHKQSDSDLSYGKNENDVVDRPRFITMEVESLADHEDANIDAVDRKSQSTNMHRDHCSAEECRMPEEQLGINEAVCRVLELLRANDEQAVQENLHEDTEIEMTFKEPEGFDASTCEPWKADRAITTGGGHPSGVCTSTQLKSEESRLQEDADTSKAVETAQQHHCISTNPLPGNVDRCLSFGASTAGVGDSSATHVVPARVCTDQVEDRETGVQTKCAQSERLTNESQPSLGMESCNSEKNLPGLSLGRRVERHALSEDIPCAPPRTARILRRNPRRRKIVNAPQSTRQSFQQGHLMQPLIPGYFGTSPAQQLNAYCYHGNDQSNTLAMSRLVNTLQIKVAAYAQTNEMLSQAKGTADKIAADAVTQLESMTVTVENLQKSLRLRTAEVSYMKGQLMREQDHNRQVVQSEQKCQERVHFLEGRIAQLESQLQQREYKLHTVGSCLQGTENVQLQLSQAVHQQAQVSGGYSYQQHQPLPTCAPSAGSQQTQSTSILCLNTNKQPCNLYEHLCVIQGKRKTPANKPPAAQHEQFIAAQLTTTAPPSSSYSQQGITASSVNIHQLRVTASSPFAGEKARIIVSPNSINPEAAPLAPPIPTQKQRDVACTSAVQQSTLTTAETVRNLQTPVSACTSLNSKGMDSAPSDNRFEQRDVLTSASTNGRSWSPGGKIVGSARRKSAPRAFRGGEVLTLSHQSKSRTLCTEVLTSHKKQNGKQKARKKNSGWAKRGRSNIAVVVQEDVVKTDDDDDDDDDTLTVFVQAPDSSYPA